jgi:BirA family biotin operon repressor/biotin-[acetyl-CoA-carboxylase] ligase
LKLGTGHPVLHFERIDSTNAEARRLAEQGEQGPLWIVADEQTAGRGRIGRNWVSEPGNLYATFLFAITAGPEVAAQVSFVAALAVHDMVAALLPSLRTRIKWPNDVLIGGAKFCGVLPEVVGNAPTRIAIGCGVNIAHAPKDTPYPVTCLASPPPCGEGAGVGVAGDFARGPPPQPLRSGGRGIEVESVLQHLDLNLSNRLKIWDEGRGFAAIRTAWEARALGVGGEVAARAGTAEIRGIFKGLAADGALVILLPDGTEHAIHAGDVSFAELERLRNPTP